MRYDKGIGKAASGDNQGGLENQMIAGSVISDFQGGNSIEISKAPSPIYDGAEIGLVL